MNMCFPLRESERETKRERIKAPKIFTIREKERMEKLGGHRA